MRELANLLLMQAFSPALFSQGPSPGPVTLMRLLRDEITPEEVDEEFARLKRESQDKGVEKDLTKMVWECRAWCVVSLYSSGHNYGPVALRFPT